MGQQQLLLIVLGVIIVGIAIAVGINMFSSSAVDANRDAVTSDLAHLGTKALQFYKKPTTMGGGGGDFNGFTLAVSDTSNANGNYLVDTNQPDATPDAAMPGTAGQAISAANTQTMYVLGFGTETGRDGTNPVQAYATVTPTGVQTTVVN